MAPRSYGQYCGVVRSLELVGERWALLVVRDLIVGPKRFTDLRQGLPKIPTNILSARLKELEETGVVQRRVLPRPASAVVYELTDYGRELEDIVVRLARWGGKALGEPGPDDTIARGAVIVGLKAAFVPEAAGDLEASYELHLDDVVVHMRVAGGAVEFGEGPLDDADLVIETDLSLRLLLFGQITAAEAIRTGAVKVTGKRVLLERFAEVFRMPSTGTGCAGLGARPPALSTER